MSEMIERVVVALRNETKPSAICLKGFTEADARMLARVAIEAMREPTEAMIGVADLHDTILRSQLQWAWPEMVDAALREPAAPEGAPT